MKTPTYGIAILLVMIYSCSPNDQTPDLKLLEEEIITVEKAFSDYSEKNGFAKALAEFAADDVIKLNDNQYPTIGKVQLQKEAALDSIGSGHGTLTWKPLNVRVAQSGDMASVFGDWYYRFKSQETSRDTVLYGNYVTVWVKQGDGTWKFAIDGGNPTPGPTSPEMLELPK